MELEGLETKNHVPHGAFKYLQRYVYTPVKTSANSWEIRSLTRAPPFSLFLFHSKGGRGRKIFFQDIHQDLTHLHFQVENCPNDDASLKRKLQVFNIQGKFRK